MDMSNAPLRLLVMVWALAVAPAAQAQDGFSIAIGDEQIAGDAGVATVLRTARPPFRSTADVAVIVDGLGVTPRLDLEIVESSAIRVTVKSRLNYPAWVTRGEVRLYDHDARGRARLLSTIAIDPNGTATLALPKDVDNLVITHRVYDAAGRYDETAPVSVSKAHSSLEEPGIDSAARRRIPVRGGAVTIRGQGLAPGATISAFGETFQPDAEGGFALQRILPAGDRVLPIRVTGGGEDMRLDPVISIPASEWFTVATGDLTVGRTLSGDNKGDTFTKGRLAFYTKGNSATGWTVTSSADTGEGALGDIFRDFDRKDPQSVLDRLDPDLAYPTYGDDSTLVQDAPTDGKFYYRAERDGSYVLWGNYKGELRGGEYLRNERDLYGFKGVYRSPDLTPHGEPRRTVTIYAAQPDQLAGREVFLGTGGSVYFLQRSDLAVGSETIVVETRDPDTGRLIDQRRLVEGRDYRINYLQGVVILSAPLSGFVGGGTVTPPPGSRAQSRLTVSYEYTPTATDVSGFAYGGRIENWVTNDLRLGVTGQVEQTDVADQTAYSADLRYMIGGNSFVELEAARTRGPGFGQSFSSDGGLIVVNEASTGGTGEAYRFKTEVDFADLGFATKGTLSAYAESRSAGFSTLDYSVNANEQLYGFAVAAEVSDRLSYTVTFDSLSRDGGDRLAKGRADLSYKMSVRVKLDFGIAHEDRIEPGRPDQTGNRTDLAAKVTFSPYENLDWYVFGQSTVAQGGGLGRNDRLGTGVKLGFAKGWTAEGEVSGGSFGPGGRALVRYEAGETNAYFGYTLDPGRELDGVTINGRDGGQFVLGGSRPVSDAVTVFGENSYDLFGRRRALTSTYGVEYKASTLLAFTAGLDIGRVTDDVTGDFDRTGLSLGVAYDDDAGLTAKARLELRRDRGVTSGTVRDSDTLLFTGNLEYKVDDARRWIGSIDLADTNTDSATTLSGEYAKVTLGYANRPVDNDRLNLLARYTFLYDMYGQRVDGTDKPGPRQSSHVFSVDATYDVNPQWTLGGKLGLRLGKTSPDDATPLARNDAALAVINARYHLTFKWDLLVEGRYLTARQAEFDEFGLQATAYRHFGDNLLGGVGYNFGSFSDDLTDLTTDDQGIFLNVIAQF
jgi:hypothetical protein